MAATAAALRQISGNLSGRLGIERDAAQFSVQRSGNESIRGKRSGHRRRDGLEFLVEFETELAGSAARRGADGLTSILAQSTVPGVACPKECRAQGLLDGIQQLRLERRRWPHLELLAQNIVGSVNIRIRVIPPVIQNGGGH